MERIRTKEAPVLMLISAEKFLQLQGPGGEQQPIYKSRGAPGARIPLAESGPQPNQSLNWAIGPLRSSRAILGLLMTLGVIGSLFTQNNRFPLGLKL